MPSAPHLAEEFGLWLHVDCAYAGPCALLPECAEYFAGIERAHSVVTNPHKWLMTPMDLSAFYTRKPEILRQALSLVPEYLRASEDPRAVHLMDYGVPLGHRFRGLKLWFILRYFGREGVMEFLRRHNRWRSSSPHGSMPTHASSAWRRFPSPWSASACAAATSRTKRCWKK